MLQTIILHFFLKINIKNSRLVIFFKAMITDAKKNFLINFAFTAVILLLGFIVGRFTLKYLTPFVLAVIIASFMQKPANALSQKIPLSKEVSAALLAAGVYFLAAGVLSFIVYRLVAFSGVIIDDLPDFFSYISRIYDDFSKKLYDRFGKLSPEIATEINSVLKAGISKLTLNATGYVSRLAAFAVKGIPSFLFSSIVALVASCYIAKDYDRLKRFLQGIFSENVYGNIIKIKKILKECVFKLFKSYMILTAAAYLQLVVGFWILRIKYAPLIALIVALIDLLPVLGTGTVLIPWGLILISFGNSFTGFGLLIIYIITVIVRNFLEPKIIGGQIGINPLFTLLAMFVGLKVLGFWGLIIMPVALIVTFQYFKTETDKK